MFTLLAETPTGRRGRLQTTHGMIETPFFLPVGTGGAMRGMGHNELISLGAEVLLCNTYHLMLRPGIDVIRGAGGLHQFISWDKPILTDSGGYQVFSLAKHRVVDEKGALFRSPLDGAEYFLGPEEAMRIQHALGSDIIMCFDECPPSTAPRHEIERAVDRTLAWAKICKKYHTSAPTERRSLFGIIQGGLHFDLRKKCAEELIAMGFDGYALGGLAVGESPEEMLDVVREIAPLLPKEKPRYLMGVGDLAQMEAAIALGIDMFDCVLPMRLARHGRLLISDGTTLNIHLVAFKNDHTPIDLGSPSTLSRMHTKSYLRHLLASQERYGETIATMQNLGVTLQKIRDIRESIITSAQTL